VHRRLRQVELTGQLDHAQPPIASRQQPEDRGSTLDRLNSGGQREKAIRNPSGIDEQRSWAARLNSV
jgi:hypothetical protein